MTVIPEASLFSAVPFAFERASVELSGTLVLDNRRVPLEELDGVLARAPRAWWPSEDLDLQDQVFVYHESTAAWIALLSSLGCPVVNRFGLGWWVQDPAYADQLRASLTLELGIAAAGSTAWAEADDPTRSADVERRPGTASVYLVGGRAIAGSPGVGAVVSLLEEKGAELRRWQVETGILLSRSDFALDGGVRLDRIEAFPRLEQEGPDTVQRIATAVTELFQ